MCPVTIFYLDYNIRHRIFKTIFLFKLKKKSLEQILWLCSVSKYSLLKLLDLKRPYMCETHVVEWRYYGASTWNRIFEIINFSRIKCFSFFLSQIDTVIILCGGIKYINITTFFKCEGHWLLFYFRPLKMRNKYACVFKSNKLKQYKVNWLMKTYNRYT